MDTAQSLQTIETANRPALLPAAPRTATELIEQADIIQEVLKTVMKEGVDYDVIPGTKNKSLLKPGTEKIMATFRLAAEPEITDLSNEDEIRYRVNARLISPSGVFVGAGIGECSSSEEKYKWRAMVCQEEFDETDKMRRRSKWKKVYKNGRSTPERVYQIRTEPADIANTVLKMAKKRALADAVLTATACSDIFDKDDSKRSNSGGDYRKNKPQAKAPSFDSAPLIAKLEADAAEGEAVFNASWESFNQGQRDAVGSEFFRIKKLVKAEG